MKTSVQLEQVNEERVLLGDLQDSLRGASVQVSEICLEDFGGIVFFGSF